jgi:hypothetical protein
VPGMRGRLRTLGLRLMLMSFAALVSYSILELGVRLLVDMNAQQPLGVGDVNLETKLSFLPNRERTYETALLRLRTFWI